MNLLLLHQDDLIASNKAVIKGRRFQHLQNICQSQEGDTIKVGLLNNNMGLGIITASSNQHAEITFELNTPPPAKLPLTLILALPRPKMLKRILQAITTLGVEKLILINSYKVEKSYWQTPLLTPSSIEEQCILGLEQAKDTLLPEVRLEKRFKPFVEDELPQLIKNTFPLVAHPGNYMDCPSASNNQPTTLAIGPEGGWIDYEINLLQQIGFTPIQLGNRVFRVETAITAFISKIAY